MRQNATRAQKSAFASLSAISGRDDRRVIKALRRGRPRILATRDRIEHWSSELSEGHPASAWWLSAPQPLRRWNWIGQYSERGTPTLWGGSKTWTAVSLCPEGTLGLSLGF